tara:strand:- start:2489 stop:4807 length:2319 start_codon:yes stop_codon:yes gene_type:complete
MKKLALLSVVAVSASTGMGSPSVLAQTVIEEIVVTARKKVESLQDVPISITVISGDSIQEQGYRDIQTITENLPAVTVARGGGNANMYVRGVGSGANGGFEQSVGYVVDGVSFGRSRATRAAFVDLDRMEILKGPQSTLFGANMTGGVISMTTKSPTTDGEVDGYVRSSYEVETEEKLIEAAATIPISETFAIRLAGKWSDSDGFITNSVDGSKRPANEDLALRATLLWEPNVNFSAELKTTYGTLESNSALDLQIINCIPGGGIAHLGCVGRGGPLEDTFNYNTTIDAPEYRNLDYVTSVLTMSYDIGEYTLTSITGYYDQESEWLADLDGSDVSGALSVSRFSSNQLDFADQVSQELRLMSPTGGAIEWMLGAYYQKENIKFDQGAIAGFSPPLPAATPPIVHQGFLNDQESTTLSAFASATWNVSDRLSTTLGLRYTEVEKIIDRTPTFAGPLPASGLPDAGQVIPFGPLIMERGERTDEDSLVSLDVRYGMTESLNFYAAFTQGFKAGAFSTQNTLPGVFANYIETVGPETVDSFEIGAKGVFLDNRLRLNVAIFRSVYEDLQVSTLLPTPPGATSGLFIGLANAGESISKGVELDFTAQLSDRLVLRGDFAFLDAGFTDFPNAPCYTGQTVAQGCIPSAAFPGGTQQSLDDQDNPFSPEYSGNLSLRYTQPIGDYELSIEPSVYFTDSLFLQADLDPNHTQDSYAKFNLRIAIAPSSGDWEVAFVGRNLNDEMTTNFSQDAPAAAIGTRMDAVDAPTTYALQGRINF